MMKLPDRFIVRFRGGPIGGEQREMRKEDWGGRYRVPVLTSRHHIVCVPETGTLPSPDSLYRTEEYELQPRCWEWLPSGLSVYEAYWCDPHEFLHQELKKVRGELQALRTETENMQTITAALKILKEALK